MIKSYEVAVEVLTGLHIRAGNMPLSLDSARSPTRKPPCHPLPMITFFAIHFHTLGYPKGKGR